MALTGALLSFLLVGLGPLHGETEPRIVLRRASSHPIRYHLSLPSAEGLPIGSRPVLVCLAGADGDSRGMAATYRRAAGASPFVIVSPCTFSNLNVLRGETLERYRRLYSEEELRAAGGQAWLPDLRRRLHWDEAGLLAILADLKAYGAAERVYLAGFSGGGLLTYRMVVRHPDRLEVAAAVCANFNFWGHGYRDAAISARPDDRQVPVHIITGGRDPLRTYRYGGAVLPPLPWTLAGVIGFTVVGCALLARARRPRRAFALGLAGALTAAVVVLGRWSGNEAQADCAAQLLRDLGYRRVERTTVPALGHDPAARQVLNFFGGQLATERR